MPEELGERQARPSVFVARASSAASSRKYADYFAMRREGGILELRRHGEGAPPSTSRRSPRSTARVPSIRSSH